MAGVDTSSGSGSKRKVDQEINMVPFIDLLMVTISFLLITAVWSHMARLQTSASVPSTGGHVDARQVESVLHVRVSDTEQKFVLQWQTGTKVEDIATVDMVTDGGSDGSGRYRALEDAVKRAYVTGLATRNLHGDDLGHDGKAGASLGLNMAILHVDNGRRFGDVTRIIDAIYAPRRHACFEARPRCCGAPNASGASSGECATPAADVPAFEVTFSST